MKAKGKKIPPPPLSTSRGGTVLDWPVELGLSADFVQQVEVRCQQNRRRRRRVAAAGTALALLCAFTAFWVVPLARDTATIGVAAAQRQTVALPDGSHAELNAQTRIHTDFRYGRRFVRLDQGEAFFSVARDPAHPFRVETAAGTVRVVGTQFNVRIEDGHQIEVTLLQGSVALERGSLPPVHLSPRQQFDSAAPAVRSLSDFDLRTVTAWRQGQFAFDGLTLGEAAVRLAAYHGCTITVAPEIYLLRAHGSYPVDDLPGLLRALEKALSVRAIPNGNGSYRIIAP